MNRKKLFLENIFAYGFINVLNKIVPFLMLPIITRMLPDTSDFGVYSMFTTIVGFGTPLAVLGLHDAMFREYYEKEEIQYKNNVIKTAQRIIMISSFLVTSFLILFKMEFSNIFFGENTYSSLIFLASVGIFIGANLKPLQTVTRMRNQRMVFVASGIIFTLVYYFLSVVLIKNGYLYLGLIYSSIVASAFLLIFFWYRNRSQFKLGKFNYSISKELFKIGLPLVPTFLIYWIYNSMDKIMITNMIGIYELGIYSIGSKIAQASQLIYAGFAGGWQYFAFSTMKDDDQVELNSRIFEFLGGITVLSLVIIYPFIPFIFRLLFEGDYVSGLIVAPYLYLSPLLLMLFQIVSSQFLVIKKSYYVTLSLTLGAIINVILNFILIRRIGIEGAAVATLMGYYITIIVVIIISNKIKCMVYSNRIIFILLLIPLYFFVQRIILVNAILMSFLFMAIISVLIVFLYKNDLKIAFKKRGRI